MTADRSFISRFFIGIWHFIDGARKLVLNLVFLLILFIVIMAFIDSGETLIIQPDTALVLQPYGDVVEQYSGTPLDYALQQATQTSRTETRLRDLIEAVRTAKDDERIVRLVIDPTYLGRVGLASQLELEAAIEEFKISGKPVIALADNLGQQQYFLAAMADEIWLNPQGMVWIDGFAAYRQFYREGLEKLEVEVNLFRAGKFKSAMEPWIRDDMSPEAREANLFWIGSLWQQYLEAVSLQRGVPLENLSAAINDFANRLEAVDGDFARFALELGLVDRLVSRPEANLELESLGAEGEGSEGFRQVGFDNYLALTAMQKRPDKSKKVVIVVAEGEIVRGMQPQGTVGAVTLSDKLRALAEDKDVAGVVVRINSPGGDAFASEKIRREIQALKEMGKTVVVSMGDVAASGGYWIAMGADEVWASPSTITGSIGVYGILPTFSKPMARLGIHTDGVGTTELAGKLRLDRPLDPDLKRVFQYATERTYDDFVNLVAEHRQMSPEAVREVAQGRVWSGSQAKERGLVDQTGTLQQAVDAAARIAGLGSGYRAVYDEWELSPFEAFLFEMMGSAMGHFIPGVSGFDQLRGTLLEDILDDLNVLARSNSGLTVAAHCLCDVE
ncbi:MAG: signal peptide peptidase SppA [Xanthomonadales bacterium]|nr:signal peptide peptidase SppA [Gammaproteobacteria bacterium]MBT8052494.1 signal peptide peptidase SppA [Gammaproteobacteria bacterium]NND57132.1 signal peptide peptidase SppA [Xanthomonadales bacterium]NNK52782.1 signal peptide peptidase SppA [Xanthomonadales bacterium]